MFRSDSRQAKSSLTRLLSEELRREEAVTLPVEPDGETARGGEMLLRDALREGASDIHLEPQSDGMRIRLRIDGALLDAAHLTVLQGQRIMRHYKALAGMDAVNNNKPQDARRSVRLDERTIDLRLAGTPCAWGEKLTIRLLDPDRLASGLDELGMSDAARDRIIKRLAHPTGMFLAVGPTGCGKTTTLYALLQHLKLQERSVVTVEEPVEYKIDGITQISVDARRNITYADVLKSIVRLDPDYILLGEMREPSAAQTALTLCSGGRGLLSSLHARDAAASVSVLRNWGISNLDIAATLETVVAQRLVRKLCIQCRRRGAIHPSEAEWLASSGLPTPETAWQPVGCGACHQVGYQGRIAVFEVWCPNEQDRALIREGADEHHLRHRLIQDGMTTLVHEVLAKTETGVTTLSEAMRCPPALSDAGASRFAPRPKDPEPTARAARTPQPAHA